MFVLTTPTHSVESIFRCGCPSCLATACFWPGGRRFLDVRRFEESETRKDGAVTTGCADDPEDCASGYLRATLCVTAWDTFRSGDAEPLCGSRKEKTEAAWSLQDSEVRAAHVCALLK